MDTTIERIDRHPIEVPYRPVTERNMDRELPHWRYLEILEVELADGSVGYGETLLFYTWGETTDEDVERAHGERATSIMWDDSLGAGLQIALFDAVGKAVGCPITDLLGGRVHDETPVSWWCIDMPGEDWVTEARRARELGYRNIKLKARPWFDLDAQLEALDDALPASFAVDLDYNGTLLDAERGLPHLESIVEYPQVTHIEGPIPQEDVEGNASITEALDVPVALHYGRPEPITALCETMCDGFVVSGGASQLRDTAAVASMAEKPFWLQLVGTGITAAFALHCGGAFKQATWPAITCREIYEHELLEERIEVEDGYAEVPTDPGLGYEVDMDAVERFRCEKPEEQPNPPRLIEANWPEGPTIYFAENETNFMITYAREEGMPYFAAGAHTWLVPDHGSDRWEELHEGAREEPVVHDEPVF